jgi:hypothetical protein
MMKNAPDVRTAKMPTTPATIAPAAMAAGSAMLGLAPASTVRPAKA